jgi:hypothetical protein
MRGEMTGDLWLFVVHGQNGNTWTRAEVPQGIKSVRDLVAYLQRGGRVMSQWMEVPERARFAPRVIGQTVLAQLPDGNYVKVTGA